MEIFWFAVVFNTYENTKDQNPEKTVYVKCKSDQDALRVAESRTGLTIAECLEGVYQIEDPDEAKKLDRRLKRKGVVPYEGACIYR